MSKSGTNSSIAGYLTAPESPSEDDDDFQDVGEESRYVIANVPELFRVWGVGDYISGNFLQCTQNSLGGHGIIFLVLGYITLV